MKEALVRLEKNGLGPRVSLFSALIAILAGVWGTSRGETGGPLVVVMGALLLTALGYMFWHRANQWEKFGRDLTDDYRYLARTYVAALLGVPDDSDDGIAIRSEDDPNVFLELVAKYEARQEELSRQNGKSPRGRRKGTTDYTEKQVRDVVREVYAQCVKEGERPTWVLVADRLGMDERTILRYRDRWGIDWPSRE